MVEGSPDKGWMEISEIMKKGRVSDKKEAILFNMSQSENNPNYTEITDQSTLDQYQEDY